jgi:phenylacetate-CoA oxygenase PaaH subunit
MIDTQWPKFEVFQQTREGQPHQNAGSVHAPDAEMALQNARDVFVRRPGCVSLWVVPDQAIYRVTDEELRRRSAVDQQIEDTKSGVQTFCVFQKHSQRPSMNFVSFVGQIEACNHQEALLKALEVFQEKNVYVWWICPEQAIVRSRDEDIDSMFRPALDKKYRMPQSYQVLREMMEIKSEQIGLSDIEKS